MNLRREGQSAEEFGVDRRNWEMPDTPIIATWCRGDASLGVPPTICSFDFAMHRYALRI